MLFSVNCGVLGKRLHPVLIAVKRERGVYAGGGVNTVRLQPANLVF